MQADTFYHIYNHANGNENLFRSDGNYLYFLNRYTHFINPVADTFAYCLMPNHFHFLIQIKNEDALKEFFKISRKDLIGFQNLSGLISKQFSHFFNAYSKAYNQMYKRRGSLFNRPFKVKEVTTETYSISLIHYIHANPVHHGFVTSITDWPFSSYSTFLSNKKTLLQCEDVLEWFNGKDDFIKYHQQPINPKVDFDFD